MKGSVWNRREKGESGREDIWKREKRKRNEKNVKEVYGTEKKEEKVEEKIYEKEKGKEE